MFPNKIVRRSHMKSRFVMSFIPIAALVVLTLPVQVFAQKPRYKLIDLGTFGGPNSFFAGPNPVAQDVNNEGLAMGAADIPAPDPYYPNCFNDCSVQHAFKWKKGALIDIGVLPGGSSSDADALSANGHIAGFSQNGLIDPLTGLPENRAVMWTKAGEIIDLGTLGGNESFSNDVNDLGQVVGMAANAVVDPFSFIGATQGRAFLWENGAMRDLKTLGGPDAFALYINHRGQVAGISYTDSTANQNTGVPTIHPFLWENGRMSDLGSLGGLGAPGDFTVGFSVEVNSLNARGEVVGTSPLAGDQTYHAVLWNGSLLDLGTLGGNNSRGWWVSDSGLVVGNADVSPQSTYHHAFLWKDGVMTDLRTLGSCFNSTAFAVNSSGQAVGDTGDCPGGNGGPSFFSEHGQPMVDINTLVVPSSDIEIVDALYITDAGVVAATGILPNGDEHAVLLVPASAEEIAAADVLDASRPMSSPVHAFSKDFEKSASSRRSRGLSMFRRTHQLASF
jgi:probable HAF family extracellular repeat protein